jgi:ABC-2 type transport system permease protein
VFLLVFLVAMVFSALGTAIGSVIQDIQGFQLVMNFLVMPIYFLSGALYPLANLSPVMKFFTRLDPLTYGVDGLRGALTGHWQLAPMLDATVLAAVMCCFLVLGAYLFSRIQV